MLFGTTRRRVFAAAAAVAATATLLNTILFVDVQVATTTVDLGVKVDEFAGAKTIILGNAFTSITARDYKAYNQH